VKRGYNDVARTLPRNRLGRYGSPMRRSPLVLVTASALLSLTACAQSPTPSPSPSASGPPAFPRVAGEVVSQSEPNPGDWLLAVRVADPAAAYREARSLLTEAGFQVTNDAPSGDGGNGQACTTRLCVSFTAVTHPGQRPTVDYEVFHSTGVVG
jgi:hypothetical protein